jgi:hypothetical protein
MAHLLPLVAGLLMIAGTHASDVADRSMHQGFLSQYRGSDASKTSRDDYNKFVTPRFNHMKHGGAPDALSHHNGPAERGPAPVQKVLANDNSMPIGMSAIGVSLLTLAAMFGARMWRGLQQATAFASSDGHESDMSIALAPAAAGNILEMKTQESTIRGQVGWSQQSSDISVPLTLCYACRRNTKKEKRMRNKENMRKFKKGAPPAARGGGGRKKKSMSRKKLTMKAQAAVEKGREEQFMSKLFLSTGGASTDKLDLGVL